MISRRLALWVYLWPYFSSRGRRISTFDSGIPPEITHSTISNRNKRISASNVDPLRCSRMSHLLTWLTGFASCLSRCEQLRLYACLTLYACRLSFSLTKGSHCEHYKANFHSPLRNVVLDGLSRDPKRMLCFLSLRTRSSYHFLVVCICLRFLEIEALAGLLRVAPAAMVTSIGSISVFSSSDLSASNCDASHCSKYQDGGRDKRLLKND